LISTDQSLTLATGNGQVLIEPNNVKVGPLTATGMATAKGTETTDSHHIVIVPAVARMRGFGDYEIDGTMSAVKARDYKDATDLVVGQSQASAE